MAAGGVSDQPAYEGQNWYVLNRWM
jgi:hypothetical protein